MSEPDAPNPTGSTIHERLLKGELLRLKEASAEDRTIMAEWISEAASKGEN